MAARFEVARRNTARLKAARLKAAMKLTERLKAVPSVAPQSRKKRLIAKQMAAALYISMIICMSLANVYWSYVCI